MAVFRHADACAWAVLVESGSEDVCKLPCGGIWFCGGDKTPICVGECTLQTRPVCGAPLPALTFHWDGTESTHVERDFDEFVVTDWRMDCSFGVGLEVCHAEVEFVSVIVCWF